MGFRLLASDETAALGALKLTYPEVGASMTALPARYHHIHQTASIGTGAAAQAAMADALLQWKMHVRAKLEVAASHELVVPGAVVVLGFSYGPARVTAPRHAGSFPLSMSRIAAASPTGPCQDIPSAVKKPFSSSCTTTTRYVSPCAGSPDRRHRSPSWAAR